MAKKIKPPILNLTPQQESEATDNLTLIRRINVEAVHEVEPRHVRNAVP